MPRGTRGGGQWRIFGEMGSERDAVDVAQDTMCRRKSQEWRLQKTHMCTMGKRLR